MLVQHISSLLGDPHARLSLLADERLRQAGTLADVAAALAVHGFFVRRIHVDAEDLRALPLPLVIGTAEGMAVLTAHSRGRFLMWVPGQPSTTSVASGALGERFTGEVLEILPPAPESHSPLPRVLAALRSQPSWIAGLLTTAALVSALALVPALLLRSALDLALPARSAPLLLTVAIVALLAAVVQAFLIYARGRFALAVSTHTTSLVRHWLLSHLLRLPFMAHNRANYGAVAQSLSQSERLTLMFTQQLNDGLVDLLAAALVVPTMIWISPLITTFLLLLSAFLIALSTLVGVRVARAQRSGDLLQADAAQTLSELVHGIEDLKSNGAEVHWTARWKTRFLHDRRARLGQDRLGLLNDVFQQGFREICWLSTLLGGAHLMASGRLSPGDVLGLLSLSAELSATVGRLAAATAALPSIVYLAGQVQTTLSVAAEPTLPPCRPRRNRDALVLEDLCFRYAERAPWIVEGLAVALPTGRRLVIRGSSGAGKTTVLRLIAGLVPPSRGTVTVCGWQAAAARHLVGYCPQDASLWGTTLRENLTLYSGGASREKLLDTARATGLADWVDTLPLGYETRIVSHSATVSGGQRQLVLLTGCLASEAPILLLDEAFAHLDVPTQDRLVERGLFDGRTVVMVGHDRATEKLCDGAVVIEPWPPTRSAETIQR
jgi:ABC-type bacteriocin/lantibiotic exporter with double-glycine peptidase domain